METIERLLQDLEIENPTRFPPEQIQTFTSNFSESLGSGAFGDVYKGILHNGVQVAVKVLKGEILSEGIKDQFKAEVSVLCKTHHRNLVKLYGFCFEHNMKALIYEFMENESLDKLLYGSQTIEWEILFNIVTGTANGLSYLHKDCQPRIIHYDVKPSNILLDSKFSPKVGDFGLAKRLNQDKSYISESRFRGTPNYVAPELFLPYSPVTHKCDVYSYGITLFDIIGRRRHLLGEGQKWFPNHVWKKFEEQQHEELMKECGIQVKHREEAMRILLIALQCVQFLPDDRPSMSLVVRLLKGKEAVEMPPNPFLYLGSSSSIRIQSSTITGNDTNTNALTTMLSSKHFKNQALGNDTNTDAQTEAILVGPWGGPKGENWDDEVSLGVRQILVFRGKEYISGIKIEYCGKYRESYWGRRHGRTNSDTVEIIKFDYPSEILTRVTGYYGSGRYLRSLCFFTNKKKYGPFGYEEGTYFISGKDGRVVGFHGRSSEMLDAIGLHVEYFKEKQTASKCISLVSGCDNGTTPYNRLTLEKNDRNCIAQRKPALVRPPGANRDDRVYSRVKQILVFRDRNEIHGFQIENYGKNGEPVQSQKHGYTGPCTIDKIELDYPSETMKRMSGYYAHEFGNEGRVMVTSISFFTNKKKYGPFGNETGTYFVYPEGE